MSLITSCPSCGTKFRVVSDQLRISHGWVRCGRCQEVFDATQALQEGGSTASSVPQPQAAAQPPEPQADAAHRSLLPEAPAMEQGYELPVPPDSVDDDWLNADPASAAPAQTSIAQRMHRLGGTGQPQMPHTAPVSAPAEAAWQLEFPPLPEPTQALPTEEAQALAWSEALRTPEAGAAETPSPHSALLTAAAETTPDQAAPADANAAPESSAAPDAEVADSAQRLPEPQHAADAPPLPSFVKQAQRKAWWSRPAVRFVMGMMLIFLPVALLLQVALHERNTLVAWQPQLRPALGQLCAALGCEIAPRKDIGALVLTGSSFVHSAQSEHYQLELSMRNQSALAVATPALELTLTDTQDQVLVRKVFSAKDIGAPVELSAHSEWSGTLPLKTQGLYLPVSGYRVMAFYP